MVEGKQQFDRDQNPFEVARRVSPGRKDEGKRQQAAKDLGASKMCPKSRVCSFNGVGLGEKNGISQSEEIVTSC